MQGVCGDGSPLLTEKHKLFQKQHNQDVRAEVGSGQKGSVAMAPSFNDEVQAASNNWAPMQQVLGGVLGSAAEAAHVHAVV